MGLESNKLRDRAVAKLTDIVKDYDTGIPEEAVSDDIEFIVDDIIGSAVIEAVEAVEEAEELAGAIKRSRYNLVPCSRCGKLVVAYDVMVCDNCWTPEDYKEASGLKERLSYILGEALKGYEPSERYRTEEGQGHIRWGLVERDMHKAVDESENRQGVCIMSRNIEIQMEFNRTLTPEEEAEIMAATNDIWPLNDILNKDPYHISGTGNISGKIPFEIVRDFVSRIWKVIGEHPVTARVIYLEDPPFDEWSFNGPEDLGDLDGGDIIAVPCFFCNKDLYYNKNCFPRTAICGNCRRNDQQWG